MAARGSVAPAAGIPSGPAKPLRNEIGPAGKLAVESPRRRAKTVRQCKSRGRTLPPRYGSLEPIDEVDYAVKARAGTGSNVPRRPSRSFRQPASPSSAVAQRFCNSAWVISASISMSYCIGFAGLSTPSKIYLVRPVIFRRVEFGANLRAKKCAGLALFGAVPV